MSFGLGYNWKKKSGFQCTSLEEAYCVASFMTGDAQVFTYKSQNCSPYVLSRAVAFWNTRVRSAGEVFCSRMLL